MDMATHSSILAWRISWMQEPGGLLSMGSHRVRHNWSDLACMHACIGEGNGNPLQYSCLENPRDRRAWWAAVYRVTQSCTRQKQLSSSSIALIKQNVDLKKQKIHYILCSLMANMRIWFSPVFFPTYSKKIVEVILLPTVNFPIRLFSSKSETLRGYCWGNWSSECLWVEKGKHKGTEDRDYLRQGRCWNWQSNI